MRAIQFIRDMRFPISQATNLSFKCGKFAIKLGLSEEVKRNTFKNIKVNLYLQRNALIVHHDLFHRNT